jgi:hypothetical protein
MNAAETLPGPPPLVPAKVRPLAPLQQLETLAGHAFRSGMFKKFSSASGAYMVMAMGYELGLSPVAALTSIHSIDGKPVMSGNLMWSLVLAHPDWQESHVSRSTETEVELTFVFRGKERGRVKWGMEDAKRAGLVNKDNWRKFPRAMLFNRAISEGFKLYTPHLANGVTVYTPDELGGTIDANGDMAAPPPTSAPAVTVTTTDVLQLTEEQREVRELVGKAERDPAKVFAHYKVTDWGQLTPEQCHHAKGYLASLIPGTNGNGG